MDATLLPQAATKSDRDALDQIAAVLANHPRSGAAYDATLRRIVEQTGRTTSDPRPARVS